MSLGWQRMTDEGRRLLSDAFLRGERPLWGDEALAPYLVPTDAPLDAPAAEVLGALDEIVAGLLSSHPRNDPSLDAALAPALHRQLPIARRDAADTALWRALTIARYPQLVRHRWGYGGRSVTASRYWQSGTRHTANMLERLWWIATLLEGPWPDTIPRPQRVRDMDDDGHLVTRVCLLSPGLATALFARSMAHHPPLARMCAVMLHDRGQRELEHVLPHVRTAFSVAVLETQGEDALMGAVAWALEQIAST